MLVPTGRCPINYGEYSRANARKSIRYRGNPEIRLRNSSLTCPYKADKQILLSLAPPGSPQEELAASNTSQRTLTGHRMPYRGTEFYWFTLQSLSSGMLSSIDPPRPLKSRSTLSVSASSATAPPAQITYARTIRRITNNQSVETKAIETMPIPLRQTASSTRFVLARTLANFWQIAFLQGFTLSR